MTLFEEVLYDLNAGYVDKVNPEKLFETAVTAMLKSLDPYTEFEVRDIYLMVIRYVSDLLGN